VTTKPKQNKPVKKAEWKGYHKVNLSKEDDILFDSWVLANPFDISMVAYFIDQGYKVSFSYDEYHTGVSASMYCTQAKMVWAGYTLSAWGESVEEAFQLLAYKHIVMCGEVWEVSKETSERSYAKRG
jgi:hypothetical protein